MKFQQNGEKGPKKTKGGKTASAKTTGGKIAGVKTTGGKTTKGKSLDPGTSDSDEEDYDPESCYWCDQMIRTGEVNCSGCFRNYHAACLGIDPNDDFQCGFC